MESISLNTDGAAVTAEQWRDYAGQLEAHGQHQHVPVSELPALLGDVYVEYTEAKVAEYEARQAAYARVAAQAHAHADKLDNTRQTFTQTDDDSGQRISQILD